MRAYHILALLILLCILATPASATQPPKYSSILAKINAGQEGLVWEIQNPNIYYVNYRVTTLDTATFNYTIRLFSNYHSEILDEIAITSTSGRIQLHSKTYPNGTYWVNLMRTARDEDKYCALVGYPCEVSKNLDMIRMDLGTDTTKGDRYQSFITGAVSRAGGIKGAAWTA